MEWKYDYSVDKMFAGHTVTLTNGKNFYVINIPSIADYYKNSYLNVFLNIFNNKEKYQNLFALLGQEINTDFDIVKYSYLFEDYKEIETTTNIFKQTFKFVFDDEIVFENNSIILQKMSLTLDEDLFNVILYILRSAHGIQVEPPRTFKSDEERRLYEEQRKREETIQKIRSQGITLDKDGQQKKNTDITTICVIICKAFPQYTIEQLFNMTFSQLILLKKHAEKILKYDIEIRAYAAGNLKDKKIKSFWE